MIPGRGAGRWPATDTGATITPRRWLPLQLLMCVYRPFSFQDLDTPGRAECALFFAVRDSPLGVEYQGYKNALEGNPKRCDASPTVSGAALSQAARCDMTTPDTFAKTSQLKGRFRLPDMPECEPDEKMTSAKHLYEPGNTHHVAQHFGNPDSKLVAAERYIVGVGWYKTVGSPRATAWLAICGTDSRTHHRRLPGA